MSIDQLIRYIIDSYQSVSSKSVEGSSPDSARFSANIKANQIDDKSYRNYWRGKLDHDGEIGKRFDDLDRYENSHVGDFYRKSGMKIDLKNESDPAVKSLKTVMDYISKNWDSSDSSSDGSSGNEEKAKSFEKDGLGIEFGDEDWSSKSRNLNSIDLPEEMMIKAIAVSILSETDGDCDLAKNVLDSGGLKMIKSMSLKGLQKLIENLKSVSAQIEN